MSKLLRKILGAETYFNTIGYINRVYKVMFVPYQEKGISLVPKFIHKGATCFDIGANIGRFAVVLAKATGQTGQVYCFEPLVYPRKILLKVILLKKLNWVEVRAMAFSNKAGRATMKVPVKNGSKPQPALATLGEIKTDDFITEEVTLDTLDSFVNRERIKKIDFIKCDVEGFEFQVFQGGKKTLTKHRPTIFCEVMPSNYESRPDTPSHFFKFMLNLGYDAYFSPDGETLSKVTNFELLPNAQDYFFIHKIREIPKIIPIAAS